MPPGNSSSAFGRQFAAPASARAQAQAPPPPPASLSVTTATATTTSSSNNNNSNSAMPAPSLALSPVPSPPRQPMLWRQDKERVPIGPGKMVPSRSTSLDSAVLNELDHDDDHDDDQDGSLPQPPVRSILLPLPRPRHSLARSKLRAFTSPHLVSKGRGGHHSSPQKPGAAAAAAAVTAAVAAIPDPSAETDDAPVDVFLGGSCNPTTWRMDTAMPLLDAAEISYFNPQVDEWYEALVAQETRAKESAKIIMMVIDNATRSIVCINESVEYICRQRRLVLVVQNIPLGLHVEGVALTPSEVADLNGARECLRRLAERRSVRLYDNVTDAVNETIKCLVDEDPRAFAPEVPRLRKRSSIVINSWAEHLKPRYNLSRSFSSTSIVSDDDDGGGGENGSPPDRPIVKHLGSSMSRMRSDGVFLGGNLQATSWRELVAIPMLQQAGIPFYVPFQDYVSSELQRLTSKQQPQSEEDRRHEIETERDNAELILFVIPEKSRSIAAMTEAVELICNRRAMLLVLEPLEEGCVLEDGDPIVGREYKDLARARVYLQEMAERRDIEVFKSVTTAVQSITQRLDE